MEPLWTLSLRQRQVTYMPEADVINRQQLFEMSQLPVVEGQDLKGMTLET